ncbi:hypothetical protein Msil_3026 [Methylocella silvestris BL2]|uniref:Uncharacterized protein n=1 Tax=Methylocella silvestris (strain DSM 15510 / CIP 108128 / LMG 27833 / NCIMB 13906 / BL2) TaxID=395965 RepID=B8EKQ8_METSB|nr:SH3 domain-containing protein [Methylocella silvestris]ACK51936.1 hypothetical protein Msil_3026 [Methylocella silvestris BL2]
MKSGIGRAALTLLAATTFAHAECIVADPTPTPLNARTAPNGRISTTLNNGQPVVIIDQVDDEQMRPWVYVSDPETSQPIGWVFKDYILCKGDTKKDCLTDGRVLTMRGTVVQKTFTDIDQGKPFAHQYIALEFYRARCTTENESSLFELLDGAPQYWIGRHVIAKVKVSENGGTIHYPTSVVLTPINIREEAPRSAAVQDPPIETVCRSGNDCSYVRKVDNCPAQFVTLSTGRKVWFTGTFGQDGTDGPSIYIFNGDGKDHDLAVEALQKVCPTAGIFEE